MESGRFKRKNCKKIGEAALLEQTAEDCAELSKEVLKLARILRGDNPTPKSKAWAYVLQDVIEEIADVSLCIDVMEEVLCCDKFVDEIKEEKCTRWIKRIEKKGENEIMDAVNFLKEFKRMCNAHDGCGNCPVEERCNFLCIISDEERQEIVGIVEKWSKDHPPKTRFQDFLEKYPNAPIEVDGTPKVCCENLGYCEDCSSETDCVSCWNKMTEDN